MVVVSFGMSLNVSLIGVVITRGLVTGDETARPICFQMNWLVCALFAAGLFAALLAGGASLQDAALLGLFAGVFTFRWFARCFAYIDGRMSNAIQSDLAYSVLLVGFLGTLALTQHFTFSLGSEMLLLSALLALGMLLMRPASLMQSALPDLERPAMARAIAAKDWHGLARIQRHFTFGLAAAWIGNMVLCAALLVFFPMLLLKKGYDLRDVIIVAVISALIMALRALRTPQAVLLQVAGQFKALANIGTVSAAVSVTATLTLLLAFGPIVSLGGIILGELVILAKVRIMARDWKAHHAGVWHA
jgi:hypothetical protein